MQDNAYRKARIYAQRLLYYRPRSEAELRKRLNDKGYDKSLADKITAEFKICGLIDDEKFAKLWSRRRTQTYKIAPALIRRELLLKEIEPDIVEDAMCRLKEDFNEEETARLLVEKRLKALRGLDTNKARQRLFGYLKRRGFSSTVIYKLLKEVRDNP